MNERIRELYEQAYESKPVIVVDSVTGQPVHCTGHNGKPLYHRELNLEKFAELLIRQCAEIAYQSLYEDRVFDDTSHNIRGKVMDNIKQHFGVSE